MYDTARFFTMTGDHIISTPVVVEERSFETRGCVDAALFGKPAEELLVLLAGVAPHDGPQPPLASSVVASAPTGTQPGASRRPSSACFAIWSNGPARFHPARCARTIGSTDYRWRAMRFPVPDRSLRSIPPDSAAGKTDGSRSLATPRSASTTPLAEPAFFVVPSP
jgi:hypothetical protein